jgi:hypothetical protein
MPFEKDPGVRENPKYCSLCFKDGKLCYEGNDLKEFQRVVKESMLSRGEGKLFTAFAVFMIRFAPRWKKS